MSRVEDPLWPMPSPCVNVCRMNEASGLCVGCWRTLDEIAAWSTLSDEAKREVWARLEQRRIAMPSFVEHFDE